jgi:photosystem II stability/assembly factor-like uncharacterized protein
MAGSFAGVTDRLEWRSVGPHRGGRVVAVAGDPVEPMTFYFGACAGGVWKTTDGGTTWDNCSDGFFKTAAVGAIAVADADPNVVYAGMGETAIRGNVSHGDGVYKSTDGGQTWTHCGLADTRHISRIRVHPQNPDIVYVGALGHVWGPNRGRGVYRSTDGGRSWQQVLFRSERAGVIDLTMDPRNPRILYAAVWEAQRYPHALVSGGPDSALYKSTDGGDTWTEITRNPGLPRGVIGRIGVVASPARSGRVWALVEAEDGALFRSDDGGATWTRASENEELRRRFWYYGHVFADPQDADTCWVLNLQCWKSTDGGLNFTAVPTPHGDNHDLWIDPKNPLRMIEGNDGGACVSFNGGLSWSTIYNQPTAQFYHVAADTQFPYRLYGSQQDNSAITIPSRSLKGPITEQDWYVPGGGESGYIAIRPDDPNIVFGGAIGSGPGDGLLYRYDHRTSQVRNITVWPEIKGMGGGAADLKYRFQWTFPIELSPHDPNVLYVTSQHVHRSTDEGHSWEVISPDLTRNDPDKLQPSGGPITKDNTGAEHYCTIFAFKESPHERGVLWAGTDDGLIHLSRDGGGSWQEITPPADLLPEWALISIIELSPHDPATAYVAATRYKHDDNTPYLLKTNDYGRSWTLITNGIPADDFARVIREDPARRGLLYAGTETGVYVSFDDGGNWERLGGNVPVVPIHDLIVKDSDLVLATHGRSFWILDDLTPLRHLAGSRAEGGEGRAESVQSAIGNPQSAMLFPPRPTYRIVASRSYAAAPSGGLNFRRGGALVAIYRERKKPHGEAVQTFLNAGQNPPEGVIVYYHLGQEPKGPARLTFRDASGKAIVSFTSAPPPSPDGHDAAADGAAVALGQEEGHEGAAGEELAAIERSDLRVPVAAGLNRFVWNMRYPDARQIPGDKTLERFVVPGPIAPPGTYRVELTIDGQTHSAPFELVKDPRLTTTQADFDAQFRLLLNIRDSLSSLHDAVAQIRDLREQLDRWSTRTKDRRIAESAASLKARLTAIEDELIQTRATSPLNFPARLKEKLATLVPIVASCDAAPTKQEEEVYASLRERVDTQLETLDGIINSDIAAFNGLLREANVPGVVPLTL